METQKSKKPTIRLNLVKPAKKASLPEVSVHQRQTSTLLRQNKGGKHTHSRVKSEVSHTSTEIHYLNTEIKDSPIKTKLTALKKIRSTKPKRLILENKANTNLYQESSQTQTFAKIQENFIKQQEQYLKLKDELDRVIKQRNLLQEENIKLKTANPPSKNCFCLEQPLNEPFIENLRMLCIKRNLTDLKLKTVLF